MRKQKALDADPKAIQQTIFTGTTSGATTVFTFLNNQKKQY